jgi:hypothetical protein
VERLELREEAVALAVLPPGTGLLGAPVVLVHVLELLLALLGAPDVAQHRKLPATKCHPEEPISSCFLLSRHNERWHEEVVTLLVYEHREASFI